MPNESGNKIIISYPPYPGKKKSIKWKKRRKKIDRLTSRNRGPPHPWSQSTIPTFPRVVGTSSTFQISSAQLTWPDFDREKKKKEKRQSGRMPWFGHVAPELDTLSARKRRRRRSGPSEVQCAARRAFLLHFLPERERERERMRMIVLWK